MTSLQKAHAQWGTLRAQRAVNAYKAAMRPYNEAFSDELSKEAALMVIAVSMAHAAGEASRNDVTNTLRHAAMVSGIPFDAWKAMSELEVFLAQLAHGTCAVIKGGKK
jgi:hypothetical protein